MSIQRTVPSVFRFVAGCLLATTFILIPATSRAAGLKPFTIGYNQWIGYVGLFEALDKGYFKAVGLDVQPKQFSGPADSVPPLATGQLDATLTTADTVILLEGKVPQPVKNVYIIDTSNGADGVVAQSTIKTVRDLRGKTVAATIGQCNELLLLKALSSAGMSEHDVKITNMDADTAGAALIAGKVTAAVTWEPWITNASQHGAHIIFTSANAPNTLLDTVAASTKTMTTRPADLRAFLVAYSRGAAYALAHPDDAAKVAAKYLGSSPADSKNMLTKVILYTMTDNHKLLGTSAKPGPVLKSGKMIAAFFVSQKQLTKVPDISAAFSSGFLSK
jgi:NitT/TauT family transport system substrate-binding protein